MCSVGTRAAGWAIAAAIFAAIAVPAAANETGGTTVGPSGYPLPRFVSLKASKVNLRIGPGRDYAVDWMYMKSGLPMEVVQEYDNWRRVRDAEGTEGWIYQSLLSGKRTAITTPWDTGKGTMVNLQAKPSADAATVAMLEPGAVGTVIGCTGDWCEMDFSGHRGWLSQSSIWGVYPGERIEN